MQRKRKSKRTGNQGQGGIKSPQQTCPATVTQCRANFREITGGGGKKSEIGGKNAKSAAIRTKSGLLPHKTRASLENRHPAQLVPAKILTGTGRTGSDPEPGRQLVPGEPAAIRAGATVRSWNRQRAFLFTGTRAAPAAIRTGAAGFLLTGRKGRQQ